MCSGLPSLCDEPEFAWLVSCYSMMLLCIGNSLNRALVPVKEKHCMLGMQSKTRHDICLAALVRHICIQQP